MPPPTLILPSLLFKINPLLVFLPLRKGEEIKERAPPPPSGRGRR